MSAVRDGGIANTSPPSMRAERTLGWEGLASAMSDQVRPPPARCATCSKVSPPSGTTYLTDSTTSRSVTTTS